jgi:endonuclease/exonuclease/phosphatase family metal-dependent hydrolase
MRLISFNIQHRRGEDPEHLSTRMQACADFLHAQEPDLFCCQEVTPQAYQILTQKLQAHTAHYLPRAENQPSAEGVPLWITNPSYTPIDSGHFWFSTSPEASSLSWRAAHPRICSWIKIRIPEKPPLWLFNLHLDHRSRRARRESLHLLQHQIRSVTSPGDAVLVCGDFNMSGARKEIRRLAHAEPPLQDATHTHPIGFLRPTYLGWGPFRLAKARIDLCLHSPDLQATTYHALDPEFNGHILSDHRALLLTISHRNDSKSAGFFA